VPYIKQDLRDGLDKSIKKLSEDIANISNSDNIEGIFNYIISSLLADKGVWSVQKFRYQHYNAMLGVLECVKQEIYRRLVSGYEDDCKMNNGDLSIFYQDTKQDIP
jgi:hypothetical protein